MIQPQVLLRLPCYDFTLIICPTLGGGLLKRLSNRLWVLQTLMVWRAVCTRPGNVFTVACWSTITSDSNFMQSSCRLQSELRRLLGICSTSRFCFPLCAPLYYGGSPGHKGHDDLTSSPPSSVLSTAVSPESSFVVTGNKGCARCGT